MTARSTSPAARSRRRAARRTTALALSLLFAAGGVTAAAVTAGGDHSRSGSYARATGWEDCDGEVIAPARPGDPASCAHADKAPPGVDVDKHVPTAVLEARTGAAAAAVAAAQDEGVPVAAQVAAVSDRVPCDGDGTSGYRVQAVYVVTSDRTNRFAAVGDQIKQWAAGVNTVFNLSAAKTGGVRDVRFVTSANGDGTCSPTVLNVTLPPGSFTSFDATINAMRAAGYSAPGRKYLMWVDGTGQCGIAQTYLSSTPGQDNPNNGAYAQFARIDTGCWGQAQSVEAHELSHTMGSVQGDAPHATTRGHCYDESDRMCYADGGGKTMQQICPTDQETLFDCNNDDYYSTYPAAGSYLAGHWNTASSRFLIGGGDGVGGDPGVPTVLGGTVSVNNPAVPGLPTQVAATLELPPGRTAAVTWSASRSDCVFADRTALQTEVVCNAASATQAKVTATVVDSTGAKLVRSSALTFSTAQRTASPALTVDAETSSYVACPTGKAMLTARVVDQASGRPVKGVPVAWLRQGATGTPVQVASRLTDATGVASALLVPAAGAYTARTTAVPAFPATTSTAVDVSIAPGPCTTGLTGTVDATSVQAGTAVRVTGVLTRTLPGGSTAPAAGERVSVYGKAGSATTWSIVGSGLSGADGSYSIVVTPYVSTTLQARFVGRVAMGSSAADSAAITVTPWTTALTASPSATDVMAAAPVTVTGSLTQSDGTTASPLPSAPVTVTYPLADGRTATARAATNASGTYTVIVRPTGSGDIVVRYAGKPGWEPSSAIQAIVVRPWGSALTLSAVRDPATGYVRATGTLTQINSAGVSSPLGGAVVTITYQYTATYTATRSVTTTSSGTFTTLVKPNATGLVRARYAGGPGRAEATATPVSITVP